jgi:rubrerythrin
MSGSTIEMPAELDELLRLEREHNNTTEFLAYWARLLHWGENACPEHKYGFKIDIDAETKDRIVHLYSKNKNNLDDEDIRDKFREMLVDIVKERKLKEFHDAFDVRDEGKIAGTIVTCNGCNQKLDILSFCGHHFYKEIYQCPICKEFYCYQCMRLVFIDLYDHAIRHGTMLEMERGACKKCFEKDVKGTLVTLLSKFEIKKR